MHTLANTIYAHGLINASGGIPQAVKSKGVLAIVDNGVGSYQLIFDEEIDEEYSCLLTPRESAENSPVLATERDCIPRSGVECFFELRTVNGKPIDCDLNFAVIYGI